MTEATGAESMEAGVTRTEILELANSYITQDRAATHGDAEDSFKTISVFWSAYLDHPVAPQDVCAMMVLLKMARAKNNPDHLDNWVDTAGYSAIGGSMVRK